MGAVLDLLTWVELSPDVAEAAASLARAYALSGADAVLLASATTHRPEAVMATFDLRLRGAAVEVGLGVAPAQIS